MTPKKAFLTTFIVTLSVMMTVYGLFYLSFTGRSRAAGTPQQGVPVMHPSAEDSKTVFIEAGNDAKFYFLLKFNRIQNKISILSISPSYVCTSTGRSLKEAKNRAGVMQCILDLQQEFGININYYISCSWKQLGSIIDNLTEFGIEELGEKLPVPIKNLLMKNAEKLDTRSLINILERAETFLDNDTGIAFLNETAYILLFYNGDDIYSLTEKNFRNIYSNLTTNINTEDLNRFSRIFRFLSPATTTYYRNVITAQDTQAAEKINRAILQ